MSIAKRLKELDIELPPAPNPVGAYTAVVRAGSLLVTSGQLPWKGQQLAYKGRLGAELNVEQGYDAARICALNALAQIHAVLGNLDDVRRIVRLEGYVHCTADFRQHPQVLNGASELFNQVLGDRGIHTRTALGIHAMPLDAPIQLVVWAEVD
jgi:enamine deaminase RidA (YjgF/YER057c/UK114 family)